MVLKCNSLIRLMVVSVLCLLCASSVAQTKSSSVQERQKGFEQRQKLIDQSVVASKRFTNIGPTIMSGRVTDLSVNPEDPRQFYAAYASGGLWFTDNMGSSYKPLFDYEPVMSIGDIAVNWKENIIWVGTGENNSSRSSYSGNGIYKSTDGGNTWQHLGLDDSQHIGRIVLHPENKDIAWVASIGHLYSSNEERGIFKTTDGGATWKKTLFLNQETGAIDLIADPKNPETMYAAMWERERKAWNFKGSGESSGIYKSTDGGENWSLITSGTNGFPHDEGVGRIGLAISHQNSNKIYALLDNQNRRDNEGDNEFAVSKKKLLTMSPVDFLNLEEKAINDFLDRHNFPNQYNATEIQQDVRSGKIEPKDLVRYLEDSNAMLFDTPVKGAEVYVSEDGGKSWAKTHEGFIDGLYFSYGYYFGNIRVNPSNDQELYIMGVPILSSDDGGANWKYIGEDHVHADHHALWISDRVPGLMINGNDGGVNISFDNGGTWIKSNPIAVGQFYTVNVDNAEDYHVYGGLQDNGVWHGSHQYEYSEGWKGSGKYPYESIMGGDGMQVEIDSRDNNTVYTGFQFGNYFRINKTTGAAKSITPMHQLGEEPLRFNWQTPVHLSKHNEDILYFGSNKFHRSMNQGDTWETLSGDLTKGGKKGNVPYGTLTTIDESPISFGLIYVGTDDGLIKVSQDGGNNWTDISAGLPQGQWVSRVTASAHKKSRVYASLNGYRWDQFDAMVYVSEDHGKTWTRIGEDLPSEPVNVIKEDPVNEDLLYVGTDHGVYISLDRGQSFMLLDKKLPRVAVHDLVIQEKAKDLVIGTHGRSIYRVNIAHLQQLTLQIINSPLYVFDLENQMYNQQWGTSWSRWSPAFEPDMTISAYVNEAGKGALKLMDESGQLFYSDELSFHKGLNDIPYDLTISEDLAIDSGKSKKKNKKKKKTVPQKKANGKYYLPAGKYVMEMTVNGATVKKDLRVLPGPAKKPRKPQKKTP